MSSWTQAQADTATHALGLQQEIKFPMTVCASFTCRGGYIGWECWPARCKRQLRWISKYYCKTNSKKIMQCQLTLS